MTVGEPTVAEPTVVAVDQGKSGTRAEARVESGASVHGAAPGLSLARGSELGSTGADAVVDAVASLRLPRPPDVVSVGTTAAPESQDARRELAAELRARLGAERVLVTEDAVTAHLGAFRGAPGVVVSAGTGAIALWSDGQTCARVDGWGPILGDHGSGVAIGGAGLRAAFSAMDGRGAPTSLMESARRHLGGLGLDAARRLHAAANPTEIISDFAVDVLRAAEEGDQVAGAIVARAATDLATSAALAARLSLAAGEHPRCCAVGQLMRSPALRSAFTERATELGLVVGPAPAGSLAGAMFLATTGPPPAFAALVGVAAGARSRLPGPLGAR
ncbi:MAG: ATPase [Actinophytocola sp.]|uniref:N-acetylglucosamine kinase n=1 Tax=Actinophytocola sp. TaxID=1872138 RepID=UPI00132B643E|nr:BadF/BadG/BcrA/BcrD ATPase family protein [Actinophytocola sp.]MPZ81683.1 ATPase [Actinophytocola sp.]